MDEASSQLEFKGYGKGEEYEVEAICDSAVYARKSDSSHLPSPYYLVSWKGYPEEKNTWEPASAIQHLRRLVSIFHKKHPEKPIATSPPVDSAPPMAKPTVKALLKPSAAKQKRSRHAKTSVANKRAKNNSTHSKNLRSSVAFSPRIAFQFFLLLVFPPKPSARPGGFFYQAFLNCSSSAQFLGLGAFARLSDFPPPVRQGFGGFSIDWPFRFSSTISH